MVVGSRVLLVLVLMVLLVPSRSSAHGGSEADAALLDTALARFEAGAFAEARAGLVELTERHKDHADLWFWLARAARADGDLELAAEAMGRSLVLDGTSIDAWYLAGLIAFDRDEREGAAYCFEVVAREDERGALGEAAREHLDHLARLHELDLARAQLEAEALEASRRASRARWGASTGFTHDTNPLYVSESTRQQAEAAASGLQVALWGWVPVLRRSETVLTLGASALSRAYVTGPEGDDFGRYRAALEASARRGSVVGWTGIDAGLSTLGWALLLDVEQVYLGGRWQRPGSAHALEIRGATSRRGAHLDGYENLEGAGARGRAEWLWKPLPALEVGTSWSLVGERAAAYQVDWTFIDSATGGEGLATIDAEASFLGHGPELSANAELPWRATELKAGIWLQWRKYAAPERLGLEDAGHREADEAARRDLRWGASMSASATLSGPVRGFATLTSLRNTSTLSDETWPIDRSFRRVLIVVGAEIRP